MKSNELHALLVGVSIGFIIASIFGLMGALSGTTSEYVTAIVINSAAALGNVYFMKQERS